MSFFQKNDKNKTLLIYDGGGLGDKLMFSRFIKLLCNKYKNNNIIYLVDDNIIYLLNTFLHKYLNLKIISYKKIFNKRF